MHTQRGWIDSQGCPQQPHIRARGIVYLIGAGPGDPELITLKGIRRLRQADVVLYDRLINDELLGETKTEAELIFVGKQPTNHSMRQEEINALLIQHAQQGRMVVRLKGGDPFVFGRGGEEALALSEANIPFEVIPGVSSAIAVPAYAGIPVTHRNHTSAVTIITGHEKEQAQAPTLDWEALAKIGGTLVILMGVKELPAITRRLLAGGLAPDTPAAAIQEGTTPQQRVVNGTLATIATQALEERITSPAIVVVGTVVSLSNALSWYESALAAKTQDAWYAIG